MAGIIGQGIMQLLQEEAVEIAVFTLVFVLVYAILRSIKLFVKIEKGKANEESLKETKKVHTLIALVVGALAVLPAYIPELSRYNIIPIIEKSLPQVSLIAVSLICLLILLGMVGLKLGGRNGNPLRTFITLVTIGLIIWIFGGSAGWYWRLPSWFSSDLVAVVLAILVFGLIVSFVMGPAKKKKTWDEYLKDTGDKFPGDTTTLQKLHDLFEHRK